MTISSASDYRKAAKRKLPPFLFHYIDGGSYKEITLSANQSDLDKIKLKQRVLKDVSHIDTRITLLDDDLAMPLILAPVGLTGMYAKRGEVQASRAANQNGIPFTLSTVSICPIEEVCSQINQNVWFQLYVLKDRGFMKNALDRAAAAGIKKLVFTVDLPTPGARYRDNHSGMSGPYSNIKRIAQAIMHPFWAWDVGIKGKPHDLGNISHYLGKPIGLEDYIGWIADNFDPSVSWKDLEWIRDYWTGSIIIKGILDPNDAKDALTFGADSIIVSNHGGRQLDSVLSTTKMLPLIANEIDHKIPIIADSGIHSGLDVIKMIALGADAAMIGRSYAYALGAEGEKGVNHLLSLYQKEMRVAMMLSGVNSIKEIDQTVLAKHYF